MNSSFLALCFACVCLSTVSGLYTKSDDVVELTESNFQSKVKNSDEVWIVEFYAPWCGHCKNLAPEYKKAASALKGIVKVGAVDCDQHKSLAGQFGVQGFPTIKIFEHSKSSPRNYNGGRTSSAIIDEALKSIRNVVDKRTGSSSSGGSSGGNSGKAVVELTEANFKQKVLSSDEVWLVEFFAPWCGHCKNLAPEYESAAKQLRGKKVHLGAVDATVHQSLASQYGVQGYPTMFLFMPGQSQPEKYEGGRTASDIVAYMSDKAQASIPPPEVKQLLSQAQLEACGGKQLCVIAVLPDLLDCQSKCRNAHIATMRKLGEKYKAKDWIWLWSAAMEQTDLEKQMNMGGFGYPALVAFSQKKMKFAPLRGSFGEEGMSEFLRDVSLGSRSIALFDVPAMPKVKTTVAWDGKDGQLPAEEEIDLSDLKDEL